MKVQKKKKIVTITLMIITRSKSKELEKCPSKVLSDTLCIENVSKNYLCFSKILLKDSNCFLDRTISKIHKNLNVTKNVSQMNFINDLFLTKGKSLEKINWKEFLNVPYKEMIQIDGDKSLPAEIVSDNLEAIRAQYQIKLDSFKNYIFDGYNKYIEEIKSTSVKNEKIFEENEIVNHLSEEVLDSGEEMDEEDIGEEFDDEEEEECKDLFSLTDKDVENLDEELEELAAESDEDVPKKPLKLYKKNSIVDDKFFNLDEMNDFLNQAENEKDSEGFFEDLDGDDEGAEYCYKDFFEEKSKPKKVHFKEDFSENNKDKKAEENEDNMETDAPVLLGLTEDEPKSTFEKRQNDLKAKIKKLEEENLAPKSWELSGEVTADDRGKDSMLETHVAFEYVSKQAPTITPDHTEMIEALIIQRIKDKLFDDPVRKEKKDETVKVFRENAIEEIQRKSLVEVYEEQFKKTRGDKEDNTEEDKLTFELEKEMNEIFSNLDGLYHFDFKPTEIVPDIQIITNMPAMKKEEVGLLASSAPDEALVAAPEETKKKLKGELKSKEERETTDKLRERRKKKKKQKVLASKGILKSSGKSKDKGIKRKGDSDNNKEEMKKLKGSQFFEALQQTAQDEIKKKIERDQGKTKRFKVHKDGKINVSAKFKL
ncbi:U3 small nucleolar ribonucleoprotein protein MPP10 [Strongyloides ratti]|uniref:U3 small nucleolar ribonucleoprotein protein MPP10 n=1 Tax=Strongyloides ratti TaxID=34506 RepID=A0A090MXC2_STRRB|nr:U3 small nucleolar ribonucleoprotein protein MPP10 [Strongyloides ratti]CEF65179.1 U3 small nucleolar ribonucleoprotein protein MPP10 [Strongyloides ratti]